jgi:tRNA-specific 2-thiouridylase
VDVKIRSHHAPAGATLLPLRSGGVELRFDEPQLAVTPGQLAVLYSGDRVLGGASIRRALA